jgi:hypothetical protein
MSVFDRFLTCGITNMEGLAAFVMALALVLEPILYMTNSFRIKKCSVLYHI